MNAIQMLTSNQPTPKDINNTPQPVLKYIRELESIVINHILKTL